MTDIPFTANYRAYFSDGTAIDVKVAETQNGADAAPFMLEVMQASAQGPNLAAVPQSRGQFGDFSFAGHGATVDELARLAQRYGIEVLRQARGSSVPRR